MAGVGERGSTSPSPVLTPDHKDDQKDRESLVEEVTIRKILDKRYECRM